MILENKLNITNQVELAKIEENMSKLKARQLFDSGDIAKAEVGSFAGLCFIHVYLFSDIYAFAGKIRDVNIAKNNFRFAPVMYLEPSLKHIDTMPQSNFDEIVEKEEFLSAMQSSVIKDIEIKVLLKNALTDQIDNRSLFMKGIDVSYYYEGYCEFKTEDL